MTAALRRWSPALLFVALVVAAYADPLFVRRNFSGRDLIAYNLPMEKSIHDAWARGRFPVWTPEISGGRPLMPNPNAGALYPLRILLSTVPFALAMRIFPVLHWIAAGLGMLVLARSIGRSRAASWLGAVTYAFSGVAVAEVFFPHIQPGMTLLPWIVWAAGRAGKTPVRRWLLVAAMLALDFLAADVFTAALAIGCAALWILLEERQGRARQLAALAAAAALGALAAAPQILATVLWIPYTNRAVLGMKLFDTFFFSIHPWRLLEFVVPYPFGNVWELTNVGMWGTQLFRGRTMGIFQTIYCGSFAAIALFAAWKSRERGGRFARVLFVAALAASVPGSLLPAAWTTLASPLPLRNPEKVAVALVLALSILSVIAFDALAGARRRLRWALAVGAALAGAAALASAFPAATGRLATSAIGASPAWAGAAAASLPGALAEGGLLWMAAVVAVDLLGRPGRRAQAAAVALLTLVPIAANRKIARSFSEEEIFSPTAFAVYQQRQDPKGEYRALGETFFLGNSSLSEQLASTLLPSDYSRRVWYLHTQTLWNRGTVVNEDFDVGDLSRVESLRKLSGIATGFKDSESFWGALALRWGIRFKDQKPVAGYHRIGGDALQDWDEHAHALPDVRLAESWRETPDAVAALHALPQLGQGEIVIESERAAAGRARPGQVRVIEKSPERLVVETEAPDAGWLFVLRAYWPFRTILLDGSPVEASPAQLAFSAVPIPQGHHRVEWQERVPGWEVSRLGPLLFGMIAAALLVVDARRNRQ